MSETSFDTSAADTLTSGLSLGQFIKNVAEECQPDKWLDIQTSSDKEWHVLHGEPVLNATTQNEISEVPLSEVTTMTSMQEHSILDPNLQKYAGTKNPKNVEKFDVCNKASHNLSSLELATPVISDRQGIPVTQNFSSSNWSDIQFGTPIRTSMPHTVSNKVNQKFLPSTSHYNPMNRAHLKENITISSSPQNISNVLEKDDSLAQRVQDLLEDNGSVKTEASKPNLLKSTKATSSEIPLLLKTESDTSNDSTIKPTTGGFEEPLNETFQDAKILLSDISSSFTREKNVETKVLNSEKALMTTQKLFNQYKIDKHSLGDQSHNVADPLESLNTSCATEYGDLPDKVDIPKDIVNRLNNIKRISEEHQICNDLKSKNLPKQAWTESSSVQTNPCLLSNSSPCDALPDQALQTIILKNNQEECPITGDVKLHVGSNPTTPQVPIEEEKLMQLQNYIEKKTGQPYISPLLNVDSTPSSSNENQKQSTALGLDNANCKSSALPGKSQSAVVMPQKIENTLTVGTIEKNKTTLHFRPDCATNPESVSKPTNTVHVDGLERCEPEGMSPPVNTVAAPLLSSKIDTPESKDIQKSSEIVSSNLCTSNDKDNVSLEETLQSELLGDESIFARIKSALSDSFIQGPVNSENSINPLLESEKSLNSSVDSLAMQVKALLKEELPLAGSTNQQDTANLSQMIENFEQTELWKFVSQFLPTAHNHSEVDNNARQSIDGIPTNVSMPESTATDSTLETSLLERIRTDLKNSFLQESLSVDSDVDCEKPKATSFKIDTSVGQFSSLSLNQRKSNEGKTKNQCHNKNDLHVIDEEPSKVDPIPGIPDLSCSVLAESSNVFTSPRDVHTHVDCEAQSEIAQPRIHFSTYKETAKNVIANQLDRAAHRNFNVSLTPAKYSGSTSNHSSSIIKHNPATLSVHNGGVNPSFEDGKSTTAHVHSAYFTGHDGANPVSDHLSHNRKSDGGLSARNCKSSSYYTPSPREAIGIRSSNPSSTIRKSSFTKSTEKGKSASPTKSSRSSASVTPMLSCGIPSPSNKKVSLSGPQRSDPSSYRRKCYFDEPSSVRSRDHQTQSHEITPTSKIRSQTKSPLLDRVTVQDWLKSPERREKVKKEKHLPTFNEMMEAAKKEEEAKKEKEAATLRDQVTDSEISNLELQKQAPLHSIRPENRQTELRSEVTSACDRIQFQYPEKLSSKLTEDGEESSVCPQLDGSDSYQQASFNTPGLATLATTSSPPNGDESDVSLHRRLLVSSSDTDVAQPTNSSQKKIPRNVDEFQSMDKKSQHQFLKQLLNYINRKDKSRSKMGATKTKEKIKKSHNNSLRSNQAVCDSDSTEYCDLPSTRPPTAHTFDSFSRSQHTLTMDEANAERIMKKLIEKINRQKDLEKPEKKKTVHKRGTASSSTPQKRRPPILVPEASSIASTDTDAADKYVIMREKKNGGHRKVAYLEELSESETALIRLKRKPQRYEPAPQRIVLHDRSVQTVTSTESMTTESDPVISKDNKISRAIQTSNGRKPKPAIRNAVTGRQENKENIGPQTRSSSFFVNFQTSNERLRAKQRAEKPRIDKGVAWYEPFKYEPCWMNQDKKQELRGVEPLTLQEALAVQNPEFISRSRERQRRILINSDERRLQEIWEEERERVFGPKKTAERRRTVPTPRRPLQITRKQMVAETREKYEQLPEVVKKREEERRKREYATYRLKAQIYKKKIQNRVLGKCFS